MSDGTETNESISTPPAPHVTARALADTLRTLYTNMIHGHYVRHTDIEATTLLAEEHAADLEAEHAEGPAEDVPATDFAPPGTIDVPPAQFGYTEGLGETTPAGTPYTKFPDPNAAGYTETSAPTAHFLTNPVEDAPQEA